MRRDSDQTGPAPAVLPRRTHCDKDGRRALYNAMGSRGAVRATRAGRGRGVKLTALMRSDSKGRKLHVLTRGGMGLRAGRSLVEHGEAH